MESVDGESNYGRTAHKTFSGVMFLAARPAQFGNDSNTFLNYDQLIGCHSGECFF